MELKEYANSKNIKIIGDMPVYPVFNSVETQYNPKCFEILPLGRNLCSVQYEQNEVFYHNYHNETQSIQCYLPLPSTYT